MKQALFFRQAQPFALVGREPGTVTSQDVFSCLQAGEAVFASGPAESGAVEFNQLALLRTKKHQPVAGERWGR